MRTNRSLSLGLYALAALVIGYALLGPLVLGVIHFRTSTSGLNQIRGGDLAALVIIAPVCVAAGWLAGRGHRAAPVLALAPALFAMYTYSQLVLANEYLHRPGNAERFFPLLLTMFLLATGIAIRSWNLADPAWVPAPSRRLERGSGILLIVMAAVLVFGLHLSTFVDALRDPPTGAAYLETPTAFWVVKFYDLGIVAPAALAVGVGLLRRQNWALRPAYGILGAFVLLGWSVAGMAWSMLLNGDPSITVAIVVASTLLPLASSVFAYFLYRPLFHRTKSGTVQAAVATGELIRVGQLRTTLPDGAFGTPATGRPIPTSLPPARSSPLDN